MLRTIIVGCGRISQAHAQAIASVAEMQLVAAVDTVPSSVEDFAHKLGITPFCDLKQAISATKPQAAIVCVPPAFHEAIVNDLLDAGIHVLCEKPLAPSIESSQRMVQRAKSSGLTLQMATKFRHVREIQLLREMIQRGELGRVLSFDILFSGRLDLAKSWHANREISGGGVLQDNGPHAVDLVQFLFGSIQQVSACSLPNLQPVDVEDNALVSLETASGVSGYIELSWSVDRKREEYLRVFGEKQSVFIGWKKATRLLDGVSHDMGPGYQKNDSFIGVLKNFAATVSGSDNVGPTLDESLHTTKVVEIAAKAIHPMVQVQ